MNSTEKFNLFFEVHEKVWDEHINFNHATNNIIGLHIFSNKTKITYEICDVFERGGFKDRYFEVFLRDLTSPNLKFFSKERWKYGFDRPHKFITINLLKRGIEQGTIKILENQKTRVSADNFLDLGI